MGRRENRLVHTEARVFRNGARLVQTATRDGRRDSREAIGRVEGVTIVDRHGATGACGNENGARRGLATWKGGADGVIGGNLAGSRKVGTRRKEAIEEVADADAEEIRTVEARNQTSQGEV